MNNNNFLPPPVRLSQAFDGEAEGGMSRRRFIKRSGGATLGTLVAWNLVTKNALANGSGSGSGSNDYPGMLCTKPTLADIAPLKKRIRVNLPTNPVTFQDIDLVLHHSSDKLDDPTGTQPYGGKQFQHTAFVEAFDVNGSKLATSGITI